MYAYMILDRKAEMIQIAWRRYRGKEQVRRHVNAVVKIQCLYRGKRAREQLRGLRREARDVQAISKQRDLFRDEALRLRREVQSTKEKPLLSVSTDSAEVRQLKDEIAALKLTLSQRRLPREPHSPGFPKTIKSEFLLSRSPNLSVASVASDSSAMNRSLLDEVDEEESDSVWESPHHFVSPSSTRGNVKFEFSSRNQGGHEDMVSPSSTHGNGMLDSSHDRRDEREVLSGTPFREQVSVFHRSISRGDEARTFQILDQSEFCLTLVNECSATGKSPLHMAVSSGKFALAKTLLEFGAAANCQDFDGNTPLHVSPDSDTVGLLLEIGRANPSIPNNDGLSALHVAVGRLDVASVQLMLQHNADVNVADNSDWLTPLHLVASIVGSEESDDKAKRPRARIANLLCAVTLPSAADLTIQDKNGNTPLHNVAVLEIEEACDLLRIFLDRGGQPNLANTRGQTPLHLLCHNDGLRKVDVMQEMLYNMLYHGANPNITSQTGCTALHLTLYHRDIDSSVQLMNRGAELHLLWNKVG